MTVNVTCAPGRDAWAGFVAGSPALVLYLGVVSVTVQCEQGPDGHLYLANFCRNLAREAARMAAVMDPDGEAAPPEGPGPRHRLVTDDDGDSGAGY